MNSLGPQGLGGVLPSDVSHLGRPRTWSEVGLQQPLSASSDPGTGTVPKQKRQRSANWTLEEELTLVSLFRDLEKQFETKKQLWEQLAALLQERGGFERKPLSLEQKWGNMIQSYRAIKEHDRTKVHVANRFFSLSFDERKTLLQTWKVNNLDDKTFDSMDDFLKDRERGTQPHSGATSHTTSSHHALTHPAPHHHAVPMRHIEVNHLQPNNILGSVANTILVKMIDAERYFAKTAAHDVEKCKQYLGLLKECSAVFREVKDNMVALPAANGMAQMSPQQPQYTPGLSSGPPLTITAPQLPMPMAVTPPPASNPMQPPVVHRHMQQQQQQQQQPLPHHQQPQQPQVMQQQQQQQPPPQPPQQQQQQQVMQQQAPPPPPQQQQQHHLPPSHHEQPPQQQQQHHLPPSHHEQPPQGHMQQGAGLQQPPHPQLGLQPGVQQGPPPPPPPPLPHHQQHQQGQRHPV